MEHNHLFLNNYRPAIFPIIQESRLIKISDYSNTIGYNKTMIIQITIAQTYILSCIKMLKCDVHNYNSRSTKL